MVVVSGWQHALQGCCCCSPAGCMESNTTCSRCSDTQPAGQGCHASPLVRRAGLSGSHHGPQPGGVQLLITLLMLSYECHIVLAATQPLKADSTAVSCCTRCFVLTPLPLRPQGSMGERTYMVQMAMSDQHCLLKHRWLWAASNVQGDFAPRQYQTCLLHGQHKSRLAHDATGRSVLQLAVIGGGVATRSNMAHVVANTITKPLGVWYQLQGTLTWPAIDTPLISKPHKWSDCALESAGSSC